MTHIFISYKREDRNRAGMLAAVLKQSGWQVWWDQRLSPGDSFDKEIADHIATAGCLIVLWSNRSVESDFVKNEVRFAQDKRIPVLPAAIEEVDLPLGFQHLQTVSLSTWTGDARDTAFVKLAEKVRTYVPSGEGPPPPDRQSALLIVVDAYSQWEGAPSLRTGQANARAIKKLLLAPPCSWDDVEILHNPDCRGLKVALEKLFRQAEPGHQLLFYFFGHVATSRDGRLYLCASDTEPEFLDATAVAFRSWLSEIINGSKTQRTLIILDADYVLAPPHEAQPAGIDIAREVQNQLGRGRGKYVMVATTEIGAAIEREGEDLSPFTRHLVRGLEDDSADENDNRIVTAEEALRYIRRRMTDEKHRHLPEGWPFDVNPEDLVLARRQPGRSRPVASPDIDELTVVQKLLRGGRVVPFLGSGIYGSGPLSPFLLSSALLGRAGLRTEDKLEVATAAQYLFEQTNDRSTFLQQFREVLEEQARLAPASEIHDLLLGLEPPLLIVSASYDFVLENRLAGRRPYVLVAHVLSSGESDKEGKPEPSDEDGKLLVVRRTATDDVSFCLSDRLVLEEEQDLVIYKILGSPYLNDMVEGGGIDTVVATERDHMQLLGQLKNDHTSVPTAFSVHFSTKFQIFLGYTLDLWHYRLIAHIFERYRGKKRYAMRQPVSPIERSCWESLGVKLIQSDARMLAEMLMAPIQANS